LLQIKIVTKDNNRPWGGFFVIAEEQAQHFAYVYNDSVDVSSFKISAS
jgi:hypothetical protein